MPNQGADKTVAEVVAELMAAFERQGAESGSIHFLQADGRWKVTIVLPESERLLSIPVTH